MGVVRMRTRPKIGEIAKIAGVSTATVDRVLNNRASVSRRAVTAVREALRSLTEGKSALPVVNKVFDVILPRDAGQSTEYLRAAFQFHAERMGIRIRCALVERLNPGALSAELRRCAGEGSSGIAFQALEDPDVRSTVSQVSNLGIPMLTVVSGLSGMGIDYIGLDNREAGRTAGYLMGLLRKGEGVVAIVWGGHLYRGHDEREFGFRSILRNEFPAMDVVDVTCTQDSAQEASERLDAILKDRPDISGVYCVGGGILGTVKALDSHTQSGTRVVIGHNLTTRTRDLLVRKKVDVIIHQDMVEIARKAINHLTKNERQNNDTVSGIPVQVITRENLSDQLSINNLARFLE